MTWHILLIIEGVLRCQRRQLNYAESLAYLSRLLLKSLGKVLILEQFLRGY